MQSFIVNNLFLFIVGVSVFVPLLWVYCFLVNPNEERMLVWDPSQRRLTPKAVNFPRRHSRKKIMPLAWYLLGGAMIFGALIFLMLMHRNYVGAMMAYTGFFLCFLAFGSDIVRWSFWWSMEDQKKGFYWYKAAKRELIKTFFAFFLVYLGILVILSMDSIPVAFGFSATLCCAIPMLRCLYEWSNLTYWPDNPQAKYEKERKFSRDMFWEFLVGTLFFGIITAGLSML